MKLRETRFRSVQKKNYILRVFEILLCAGTALMWLSREKLGLEIGDMMIMTGVTVFVASLSLLNRHAERKNKLGDSHIDKLRDEIGTEDYKSSAAFFK
ncbi:MAG: hypothetical protein IJZ72_07405 [Oscillospiraceae bacterium]|nr:hypothetical protein [Oscillospiraceae bacterium]